VLHVHDLVDNVSEEAEMAGRSAAEYITGKYTQSSKPIKIIPGDNIGYVVPQSINFEDSGQKFHKLYMRVKNPDENVSLVVRDEDGNTLARFQRDIVEPGLMESVALPVKSVLGRSNLLEVSSVKQGV
jgi:hypothetical protein